MRYQILAGLLLGFFLAISACNKKDTKSTRTQDLKKRLRIPDLVIPQHFDNDGMWVNRHVDELDPIILKKLEIHPEGYKVFTPLILKSMELKKDIIFKASVKGLITQLSYQKSPKIRDGILFMLELSGLNDQVRSQVILAFEAILKNPKEKPYFRNRSFKALLTIGGHNQGVIQHIVLKTHTYTITPEIEKARALSESNDLSAIKKGAKALREDKNGALLIPFFDHRYRTDTTLAYKGRVIILREMVQLPWKVQNRSFLKLALSRVDDVNRLGRERGKGITLDDVLNPLMVHKGIRAGCMVLPELLHMMVVADPKSKRQIDPKIRKKLMLNQMTQLGCEITVSYFEKLMTDKNAFTEKEESDSNFKPRITAMHGLFQLTLNDLKQHGGVTVTPISKAGVGSLFNVLIFMDHRKKISGALVNNLVEFSKLAKQKNYTGLITEIEKQNQSLKVSFDPGSPKFEAVQKWTQSIQNALF